jgi:hypothetical protein
MTIENKIKKRIKYLKSIFETQNEESKKQISNVILEFENALNDKLYLGDY